MTPYDILCMAVAKWGVHKLHAEDCVQDGALALVRQGRPLDAPLWLLATKRAHQSAQRKHANRVRILRENAMPLWVRQWEVDDADNT